MNTQPLTPFQYQVKKLDAAAAMQVWDLARPEEREQIRAIVQRKIWQSKALPLEKKTHYQDVLSSGR